MNTGNILLWGFASTITLTTIMAVSKPLGLSRIDMPFLLGTMLTGNRNRAPFYGLLMHIVVGMGFGFIYSAIIDRVAIQAWLCGLIVGTVHGAFVLSAGLQIVSAFHPRMAHPYQGPTPTRQLQPPGLFALNYGNGTPVVTLFAHMTYGVLFALFY